MGIITLAQGIVLGFSIAMPVGPIGILCIQRTLTRGRVIGFVSGLGAATADGFYGLVAGFGLTAVSEGLLTYETWIQRLGGAFLLYLGTKAFLERPKPDRTGREPTSEAAATSRSSPLGQRLLSAYSSTVLLTLTNPATILSFLAVFAGLGLARAASTYVDAIALVSGVFIGSALWWLCLSGGVSLVRRRLTPGVMGWLNRGSGILLTGFGLASIWLSK
ncbi:MAG: LysE family translocator [Elainellaceae cyanobacterium]